MCNHRLDPTAAQRPDPEVARSRVPLAIALLTFALLGACGSESTGNADSLPLSRSCEDLGLDMASPDMAIGAGQADIELPPRRHRVEISAPGILDQADTEYVLTADVMAAGTAFFITAADITLNLNGRTVTYGAQSAGADGSFGVSANGGRPGGIVIANGTIRQGNGACAGSVSGEGCNPVHAKAGVKEIGGLRLEYHADNTSGILSYYNPAEIHHNTLVDAGSVVTNRHQGIPAIATARAEGVSVHHNLILGARHRGIDLATGGDASYNEIHLDSRATNSFGVFLFSIQDFCVHHNKIYGTGVHPLGFGPIGSKGARGKVYSNYVEVENTRSGDESGDNGSACLRFTWGGDQIEVMGNYFVLRAGNLHPEMTSPHPWWGARSWGRCLWLGGLEQGRTAKIHHNYIEALSAHPDGYAAAVAFVSGGVNDSLTVQDNTIVANQSMVVLADNYGNSGERPRLVRNRFIRRETYATYKTIANKYRSGALDAKAILLDNVFEPGTELTEETVDLLFCKEGKSEVIVGHFDGEGREVIDYLLTDDADAGGPSGRTERFGDCGFKIFPGGQ